MRLKLTVSNTERGGESRTYVFEQDTVTLGRAGTCELPLDDPDRVVSKEHAQIRREGDSLRAYDLGSKNQTYVNGTRIGASGLPVASGDTLTLGPFRVEVVLDTARLVADDLDRTVFGAAFVNPFQEGADGVAAALATLRQSFAGTDYGHRDDALADALRQALGPDADALCALVRGEALPPPATPSTALPAASPAPPPAPVSAADLAPVAEEPTAPEGSHDGAPSGGAPPFPVAAFPPPFSAPASAVPADDPFAALPADPFAGLPADPFAAAGRPPPRPAPPAQPADDALVEAIAAALVRLLSMPVQFRHEFLGHTVIHAPETAFLFDADPAALLAHLSTPDPAERADRLRLLADATEAVLRHHQGLLAGYRSAVRDGAIALLNAVDPDAHPEPAGGLLPGGRERALLDSVRQRLADLRSESFAATERRVYRPAFTDAYLAASAPRPTSSDAP